MAATSDFGKRIKMRLVEMDKNQKWLIEEVKAKTGLYFDTSYIHKIMTGQIATPSIVNAICEVLDIKQ